MIYELYGCPGAGKSTLVKYVEQLLNENGFKFLNYNDIFFQGSNKIINKFWRYFIAVINPTLFPVNFFIARAGFQLRCNPKYCIYLLTMFERVKSHCKKLENEIVILDEGIIQFVTSLSHGKDISNFDSIPPLMKSIKKAGVTVNAIECNLSINENIKRLTDREQHSRFEDVENKNEMVILLKEKKRNVDYIASYFDKICTLDLSKEPKVNASFLYNTIASVSR